MNFAACSFSTKPSFLVSMIRCLDCKRDYPARLMARHRKSGILNGRCQRCTDARIEARRRKRLLYLAGYRYNFSDPETIVRRAKSLWHQAQIRSRKQGISFDLDLHWLVAKLVSGHCDVTGIAFDFSPPKIGRGRRGSFLPSIDRVNPSIGYTKENCRVVVWIMNAAKGTNTDDDVATFVRALVKQGFLTKSTEGKRQRDACP